MITGYNTDVEHDGVVYHVQTEDKGTGAPIILSLVYVGGAILASKRSPYNDLISAGFDEGILTDRLQRQHKLICAAIHAGRIEDLKRLSQSEAGPPTAGEAPQPSEPVPLPPVPEPEPISPPITAPAPSAYPSWSKLATSETVTHDDALRLTLLDDREFRSGESVTVRVQLSRGSGAWERAVPHVGIVIRTLGSTFRPVSTTARTDRSGVASAVLSLPAFKSGRAAILVRAEVEGEVVELRRVLLPQR